jgi:uncharacterized protein YcbX
MTSFAISGLYIYPIKGLKGIEVDEIYFEKNGLQFDRRWMIVDTENHRFISQRTYPEMAKIITRIEEGKLFIQYENDFVSWDIDHYNIDLSLNVTVWNDTVQCHEVDQTISYWLSNKLGSKCKLVKLTNPESRIKIYGNNKDQTTMSFADGYPALILGTSSVELLNERCPIPILFDRFRPNILVQTNTPHEEDNWKICHTEQTMMEVVKPCVRCQVINIDQNTAEKHLEPTKTLAQYRLTDAGIIFGANTVCLKEGYIKKNEIITVETFQV